MADKKKILLIDDEKDFCFFMERCLTVLGEFAVAYAINPNKGIKIAREDPPDVILLDILMPKKDGFKVLEILKKHPKTESIPVIMLTAVVDDSAKIKASQLYNDGYLVKPVAYEALKAKIDEVLKVREKREKE